jgi:hypothetical protein
MPSYRDEERNERDGGGGRTKRKGKVGIFFLCDSSFFFFVMAAIECGNFFLFLLLFVLHRDRRHLLRISISPLASTLGEVLHQLPPPLTLAKVHHRPKFPHHPPLSPALRHSLCPLTLRVTHRHQSERFNSPLSLLRKKRCQGQYFFLRIFPFPFSIFMFLDYFWHPILNDLLFCVLVGSRNSALISGLKECLNNDNAKFLEFRELSAKFRAGDVSGKQYYDGFLEIMGPQGIPLFPELVMLLPDSSRREELIQVFKIANSSKQSSSKQGNSASSSAAAAASNSTSSFVHQHNTSSTPVDSFTSNSFPSLNTSYAADNFPSLASASTSSANPTWRQAPLRSEEFPALPPSQSKKKKNVVAKKPQAQPQPQQTAAQSSAWAAGSLNLQPKSNANKEFVIVNNHRRDYR